MITIDMTTAKMRVAVGSVLVVAAAGAFFVSKWAFGHTAAAKAEDAEVAEYAASLAPSDPTARFALANEYSKTLLQDDEAAAMREYEAATALSPHHYEYWLALSRVREQTGDASGAEIALRKAYELAPHYSRVQWALGNALLRQGRTDEAFAEIRKAAAGDNKFAGPAALALWQAFDGDMPLIRNSSGDIPGINSSLALILSGEQRSKEAAELWDLVPPAAKAAELKDQGRSLFNKFIETGHFGYAVRTGADIGLLNADDAVSGKISNGGFEAELTAPDGNPFKWEIGDGASPRIGPTDGHKRSGNLSLLMSFPPGSKGFRTVTQAIAVEPGTPYRLEFYYRSEIRSRSTINWEIVDPKGTAIVASTEPLPPASDWTLSAIDLSVPENMYGVRLRLNVAECGAPDCSLSGSIWFDDMKISKL